MEEHGLKEEVKDNVPEKVAEWFMQKPMSRERKRREEKNKVKVKGNE